MSRSPNIINVSIFGPPDHGKSTLIGYLYSQLKGDFDIHQYEEKMRVKLGPDYRHDRRFAYICDIHDVEQKGYKDIKEKGAGTSQYIHTLEIPYDDKIFYFIDSPGHYKWRRKASKGVERGDIHIFLISINEFYRDIQRFKELLKASSVVFPTSLRQYIVPLFLAIKLKLKIEVIVFSKMDLIDFNEEIFAECQDVVQKLISKYNDEQFINTKIIPTSILVKEGIDINIISPSNRLSWWKEECLIERLISFKKPSYSDTEPVCFPVQQFFFKVRGHSCIAQGKILRGSLKRGQKIKLAPIYRAGTASATAEIKSIHLESNAPENQNCDRELEVADAGNFVGLSLRISTNVLNTLKLKKSTLPVLIISSTEEFSIGDIICIQLTPDDVKLANEGNILEYNKEVQLLINGKYIAAQFIGVSEESDNKPVSYCFRTVNVPIAGIKKKDRIEGLNIVVINEVTIKEKGISNVYILGSTAVSKIGYLKSFTFFIPSNFSSLKELAAILENLPSKSQDSEVEITMDSDRYSDNKRQIDELKDILSRQYHVPFIPRILVTD